MLENEEKNENAAFVSLCGDIDLTAFCENPNLKDTWARQVRDMLENEEKNENAEFRVKEVEHSSRDLAVAVLVALGQTTSP
ncbi:hypothetical protein NC651_017255 [Populus alba x Populus x berolinensis]|nr:hypothetical protein NC651_017255 [Populus alba x Populus x berolinensis]